MDYIEELLSERKKEIEEINAPEDLEHNLRRTLKEVKVRRKLRLPKAAAIVILAGIIGFNSSTLAFYGKQLLGYDNVMNGTLKELGELGMGQAIDKSHTFSDGMKLQLDWVMLDENGIIVFYTFEDTKKTREMENLNISTSLSAPFLNGSSSGTGEILQDEHKQKWALEIHDVPKAFVNKIEFRASYQLADESYEEGIISFKLDRNAALGGAVRNQLNKKIELAGRKITIESITMSKLSTVVKGEIQDIISIGFDRLNGEVMMPQVLQMTLFADGVSIDRYGSGINTNISGSTFEVRFDRIPEQTRNIELVLDEISVNHRLDEVFLIEEGSFIDLLGNKIEIRGIEIKEGNTMITIATDDGVRIPSASLIIDGEEKPLLNTTESQYEKKDGGTVLNIRTLYYEGVGDELKLSIGDIRYTKRYGLTIYKEALE